MSPNFEAGVGFIQDQIAHNPPAPGIDQDKDDPSLDWIFTHGKEVLSGHKQTASAWVMMRYMRIREVGIDPDGSWGSAFIQVGTVLYVSYDYLMSGDKEGWLKFIGYNKEVTP